MGKVKQYIKTGTYVLFGALIGFYIGKSYGFKQGTKEILNSLRSLQTCFYEKSHNTAINLEESYLLSSFGNNLNTTIEILELKNSNFATRGIDVILKIRELEENIHHQNLFLKQEYYRDFYLGK